MKSANIKIVIKIVAFFIFLIGFVVLFVVLGMRLEYSYALSGDEIDKIHANTSSATVYLDNCESIEINKDFMILLRRHEMDCIRSLYTSDTFSWNDIDMFITSQTEYTAVRRRGLGGHDYCLLGLNIISENEIISTCYEASLKKWYKMYEHNRFYRCSSCN